MEKVPVWQTVGRSFGFAFERYPRILGAVWLPALLLFLCDYLALRSALPNFQTILDFAVQHPNERLPPGLIQHDRFGPAVNLLVYVAGVWLNVGVIKEALGTREKPGFVYVALGMAELRLIGAWLLWLAFVIGAAIVLAILAVLFVVIGAAMVSDGTITGSAAAASKPWLIGAAVVCALAVVAAAIYFAVRLMVLVGPVTVAERRFGLWRSWELSKGNFWRLFGIELILSLAVAVVQLVVLAGFLAAAFLALKAPLPQAPAPLALAVLRAILGAIPTFAPIAGGVVLLLLPITAGLRIGATVFAYRALVPELSPDSA